ncbi:MAG: vWA domain-containing protein, partial [Planctomycetota bacterium]|nr:vWA domain-containing protein [Planctomycetota bacterium]
MVTQEQLLPTAAIIALLALLICAVGEWLHLRRIQRIERLAFGDEGPHVWTHAAPYLRAISVALLAGGLWILAHLESKAPEIDPDKEPSQHLLIALDVSPSMYLEDAGPKRNLRRGTRASDVLEALFQRLDMTRTRVSVVAFYTEAMPVVLESFDINVVRNVLNALPMEHAFPPGQTKLQMGVEEALTYAKPWPRDSATLVVVSDGDTVDGSLPRQLPISIADVLVVGVGDPYKGSPVAGRTSRQNKQALERLAVRLKGRYHDGNTKHLPSNIVRSLSMAVPSIEDQTFLRDLAVAATAIGGTIIALLPILLARYGTRRRTTP